MATNGVRQCTICRTEVVNDTKWNHTSVECDMKYHSPKMTIYNQTLSPFNLMTSFQSKRHWDCFLPHRYKITWIGYIHRVSQEECARLRESVPYVKVYRYNPKHLYPKLNGYGDNGQRKVRFSCGSTYCTFSADALRVHCTCPWDWNAVNIMPACPCKVPRTVRTTMALMRVFM